MTLASEILETLTRSDLTPGALEPLWYRWVVVQGAHGFLGVLAALWPVKTAAILWAIWAVKELAGDIWGAGGAWWVVVDSGADLATAALGWALGRWMLARGAT